MWLQCLMYRKISWLLASHIQQSLVSDVRKIGVTRVCFYSQPSNFPTALQLSNQQRIAIPISGNGIFRIFIFLLLNQNKLMNILTKIRIKTLFTKTPHFLYLGKEEGNILLLQSKKPSLESLFNFFKRK